MPAQGGLENDIHARLWPDVHVSEANLANLVVELRAALGDEARRPRVIRTVARFGYAFIAAAWRPNAPGTGGVRGSRATSIGWSGAGARSRSSRATTSSVGIGDAVVWIDDESVSRRHAQITIGPKGATIEDLGSKNGTYVAGRKIRGTVSLDRPRRRQDRPRDAERFES